MKAELSGCLREGFIPIKLVYSWPSHLGMMLRLRKVFVNSVLSVGWGEKTNTLGFQIQLERLLLGNTRLECLKNLLTGNQLCDSLLLRIL
jgi:hypothetical protein